MNIDADLFVSEATGKWDVVLVDFPDPASPDLSKLYSLEFYLQLKQRLEPGGAIALQGSSPYDNRSSFWSMAATLEAAGFMVESLHANVPTFGEWGWHIARLHAARAQRDLPSGLKYLTPDVLSAARVFPPTMSRRSGDTLVSTRLEPWVMRLYMAGEPLRGEKFYPGRGER